MFKKVDFNYILCFLLKYATILRIEKFSQYAKLAY